MDQSQLSESERADIAEILTRRANDIASYTNERKDLPGSVELGLTREMARLRGLAERVTYCGKGDASGSQS